MAFYESLEGFFYFGGTAFEFGNGVVGKAEIFDVAHGVLVDSYAASVTIDT